MALLDAGWRVAFDEAWESLREGSWGIGAVIVADSGTVVSQGRARDDRGDASRPIGSRLAHAEVEAICGATQATASGLTLLSTLEPCTFCASAIVLTRIPHVRFAGADPLWAGGARLPELNDFIRDRWPERQGPRDDELGALGTLLPLWVGVRMNATGNVATAHRAAAPGLADLGVALVASGELDELLRGPVDDALVALGPRLRAAQVRG